MGELQKLENPYKRIMIAGGGNIGKGLAKSLEENYHVKLIEADPKRALSISDELENTIAGGLGNCVRRRCRSADGVRASGDGE